MTSIRTAAYRVDALPEPSKALKRYAGALLHAAQMEVLTAEAEDREIRQANTRAVALRRLAQLSPEDRARVEAVQGVIE